MPVLIVDSDGGRKRYRFDRDSVTIGRGVEAEIQLKDVKTSRRHCRILKEGTGYKVVDLSSGNGTFVNGVQVGEQPLRSGDTIEIGDTSILFEESAPPEAPAKPAGVKVTTGRIPQAPPKKPALPPPEAGAAAAAEKPATQRVPTGSIPKAPEKKPPAAPPAEAAAPAEKAPTGKVARGGTEAVKKTGRLGKTDSIEVAEEKAPAGDGPREATSRIAQRQTEKMTRKKGATDRVTRGAARRTTKSIGRVSKTERFTTEASRKSRPWLWVGVAAGVVAVVAVLIFLMMPPSPEEEFKEFLKVYKVHMEKARKHREEGEYSKAVKKFEDAIAECDEHEGKDYRVRRNDAELEIETTRQFQERDGEAQGKWKEFTEACSARCGEFQKTRDPWKEGYIPANDYLARLEQLWEKYRAFIREKEYQKYKDMIEKWKGDEGQAKAMADPAEQRNGVAQLLKDRDWGRAILEWRQFSQRKGVGQEGRDAAAKEIERINQKAYEDFYRIQRKQFEEPGEKLQKVMEMRPRFVGTEHLEKLDELVRELQKGAGG